MIKFIKQNWKDILGTIAVLFIIVYLAMKASGADTKLTELQVCQIQTASAQGSINDLQKQLVDLKTELDNIKAQSFLRSVCDSKGIKLEECSINVQTKEVTRKKPNSK